MWERGIDFFSGQLDLSIAECILVHIGLVIPLAFLFVGGVQCTDVTVQESGMVVRTCYLLNFFVPWEAVVDVRTLSPMPLALPGDQGVQESVISIKKGLTVFHRGYPARNYDKPKKLHGFMIRSDAHGYHDLVHAVQEHISYVQI